MSYVFYIYVVVFLSAILQSVSIQYSMLPDVCVYIYNEIDIVIIRVKLVINLCNWIERGGAV